MGKSTINGVFSTAMLVYQRVLETVILAPKNTHITYPANPILRWSQEFPMLLLPESLKRTELRRGWESSAMISPPNGFPRRSLSSSSSKSSSSSCMELGSSRSCGNEILNQRSSSGEKTCVKGKKVSVGTNNNRMVSHSKWPILSITLKFHDYSAVLKSWLPMFSADIKPFGIMASRSKRPLQPPTCQFHSVPQTQRICVQPSDRMVGTCHFL